MSIVRLLARSSRALVVSAIVAATIAGGLSTSLIAIARARVEGSTTWLALPLVWWYWGAAALQVVCAIVGARLISRLVHGTLNHLRLTVARHMLALPLARFEAIGAGRIQSALIEDVSRIGEAAAALPGLVINIGIVAAGLVYIAAGSVRGLVAAAIGIVIGVGFYLAREPRMQRLVGESAQQRDALFELFGDLVAGAKDLRLHATRRREFFDDVLTPAAERARVAGVADARFGDDTTNLIGALSWGIIGAQLFLPWVGEGGPGGAIVLVYIIGPLGVVIYNLQMLARGEVLLGRIHELTGGGPAEPTLALTEPAQLRRRIALRGVTHRYHREDSDAAFQLGPIDLHVDAGEILFIIGGNGSGKTTVAKLLLALYEPEQGELLLDDERIEGEVARERYRQLFTAIFAEVHLFGWISAKPDAQRAETARELLVKLGLDRRVQILDDGRFSTTKLSTGQRKRLALVAAYLDDRPVFLFDEWAADQDPAYKRVFYQKLLPELKARGKTCIVISHDDAYFDCADRLVKIADGKLVDATT